MTECAAGTRDPDVAEFCLRLGDDALILAQRLGEWATRSPQLEEDVALLNVGLDLLGLARALLSLAGVREGAGRGEDELAFLREESQFRNVVLAELPGGDFAVTMTRLLLLSSWHHQLYAALTDSADAELAAIAGKAVKEAAYHQRHAASWVVRLGDGTQESHQRVVAALAVLWPYTEELFDTDPLLERLTGRGVAPAPARLRGRWRAWVEGVLANATVSVPAAEQRPGGLRSGGRTGVHTAALRDLLAELQQLHRAHPGASW